MKTLEDVLKKGQILGLFPLEHLLSSRHSIFKRFSLPIVKKRLEILDNFLFQNIGTTYVLGKINLFSGAERCC